LPRLQRDQLVAGLAGLKDFPRRHRRRPPWRDAAMVASIRFHSAQGLGTYPLMLPTNGPAFSILPNRCAILTSIQDRARRLVSPHDVGSCAASCRVNSGQSSRRIDGSRLSIPPPFGPKKRVARGARPCRKHGHASERDP
jgi:hypothetical protein